MKKFLILAAAVAAMAACTKSEAVYDDNDTEIGLAPVNYMTTKTVYGPYEGENYAINENFNVFAFYSTAAASTRFSNIPDAVSPYLVNVEFTHRDDVNWGGATTPYYWPKTGSLFFAGYSPSDVKLADANNKVTYVSHPNADRISVYIPAFVQGDYKYTDGTDAEHEVPSDYTMVDLMYFDVNEKTTSGNNDASATGFPVLFNHALSWLTFNFGVLDDRFNNMFEITKVTLKDVNICASFYSWDATEEEPLWNYHNSSKDIVIFDKTLSSNVNSALTYANNHKFTIDDVLVIPQRIPNYNVTSGSAIEIKFKQKASKNENTDNTPGLGNDSSTPAVEQTVTMNLIGGDNNGNRPRFWMINKHYVYNFTFSANEILLKPSVATWDDVPVGIDWAESIDIALEN